MKLLQSGANMEHGVLIKILEWAWIGLIAVVAWILKKMWLQNTSIELLEQGLAQHIVTRNEDVKRNDAAHAVLTQALEKHNTAVMTRLDSLARKN